jgi:hypothetical protein
MGRPRVIRGRAMVTTGSPPARPRPVLKGGGVALVRVRRHRVGYAQRAQPHPEHPLRDAQEGDVQLPAIDRHERQGQDEPVELPTRFDDSIDAILLNARILCRSLTLICLI